MQEVVVTVPDLGLIGHLVKPSESNSIIIFVHGSGSNRFSIRNRIISRSLNERGFASLMIDLLTEQEKREDIVRKHLRFDIELLTNRLRKITAWLVVNSYTKDLKIGYFGSSTGAAAAINVATDFKQIRAIVSRGGRLDFTSPNTLRNLVTPTLLIVGSSDLPVVNINEIKYKIIPKSTRKNLVIIPGANHFLDEPDTVTEVQKLAFEWFNSNLFGNETKYHYSLENRYREKSSLSLFYNKIRAKFRARFQDRRSAGILLAQLLEDLKGRKDLVVIGIPNGGVIIADAIAEKIGINSFDVILTKRLKSPYDSEMSIGAILDREYTYLNSLSDNVSKNFINKEIFRMEKKIKDENSRYKFNETNQVDLSAKTVLLVDDGVYTGSSIIVSSKWIRDKNPKQVIVAVPVITKEKLSLLRSYVDRIEYIFGPSTFNTVEDFYFNFDQIEDDEVFQVLRNRTIHSQF